MHFSSLHRLARVLLGEKHDFQLFHDSRSAMAAHTRVLADSIYQGLIELHPNSKTPVKKTKLHPLSKEQKASNRGCLFGTAPVYSLVSFSENLEAIRG